MGIETLRSVLEERSTIQAEESLRRAYAEAGRIRRAAEAEEARQLAAALVAHEREQRSEAARAVGHARRLARERVLREREELLEAILSRALARLPAACESPAYRATLAERIAEALPHAPTAARIECTPSLAAVVERSLHQGADAIEVVPSPEIGTGFRITARDGSVIIDASLEQTLRRRWPWLRIELLKRIEAEAS